VPVFAYRAISPAGELVEGELDAGSEALVVERLQTMGFLPLEATPRRARRSRASRRGRANRVRGTDLTLFTHELAILLAAGQPLEQALLALGEGGESDRIASLARQLVEEIRAGRNLSDAMADRDDLFPPLYINMVRAGEMSGTLDVVLERVAELRERSEAVRDQIVSALLYPAILLMVSLGSIYLLLAFVVPQFETIFADAGAALPMPTAIVVGLGRVMQSYGWLFALGLIVLVLAFRQALAWSPFRLAFDRMMLRLPLVGGFVKTLVTARLARAFATLVGNGVDLPTALTLVRDVLPNRAAAVAMDDVITGVRQGRGLAVPLTEMRILPPLAIQMLKVGEETGRLDMTATHVAHAYERKLERVIKRLVTLAEPALIVVLGLAVGGIVMSILLAVISINDLAF
jgi:general secretion pathway protein F